MNVERLEQMALWLEDGAPHVVFNMNYSGNNVQELYDDRVGYNEEVAKFMVERDAKGLGECGSVCCIAGYALHAFGTKTEKDRIGSSWDATGKYALKAFDLPEGQTTNDRWMYHDLFDPALAPEECTPQQAAQAVRNVIAGKAPWADVH